MCGIHAGGRRFPSAVESIAGRGGALGSVTVHAVAGQYDMDSSCSAGWSVGTVGGGQRVELGALGGPRLVLPGEPGAAAGAAVVALAAQPGADRGGALPRGQPQPGGSLTLDLATGQPIGVPVPHLSPLTDRTVAQLVVQVG